MIRQVFTVLNLLHNRLSISRKELKEACEVSDRTVYRYINLLSEANVPIYFDKASNRYRLLRPLNVDLNRLGTSEAILIGVAVKLLQRNLNGSYAGAFTRIQSALEKALSAPTDDSSPLHTALPDDTNESQNMHNHITYLLILEAIRLGKKVTVETSNQHGESIMRNIIRPGLRFARVWELFDQTSGPAQPIALDDILELRIA